MKWFGRKAGRVAARPFLLRGWPVAPAGESWPRGYEAQVREAYLANPVAQRAVRLVAEGVGAVSVYDSAAPAGAGLGSRSTALVTAQLLETAAAQLLLHGNVFLQILCDADGAPAELFALRPERVSIEPDAAGWPAAYVYKAGEAKTRLAARDGLGRPSVVHLKAMHPLDDHKELYHNEALARIDAALHAAVDAVTAEPPSAPGEGQCWIVPPGAGGAWSGQEDSVACWTSGGWRFLEPVPGMLVWDKASAHWIHWRGSSWSEGELPAARLTVAGQQVVGPRQPAVPSPSGGTTIDQEARAAIAALTATLKTHGLID